MATDTKFIKNQLEFNLFNSVQTTLLSEKKRDISYNMINTQNSQI